MVLQKTLYDFFFCFVARSRSSSRLEPLDQLLKDADFPLTHRLLECPSLRQNLSKFAERRGSEELDVFRFEEGRALRHLAGRARKAAEHLRETGVDIRGGAVSGSYVR